MISIAFNLFSKHECISHEINPRHGVGHVVEGVCSLQAVVRRMRHDGGRQRVKADHVCNRQIARHSPVWRSSCRRGLLNYVAVDNVGPWQKPVGKLFLAVHGSQIILGQELKKKIISFIDKTV